MLYRIGTNSKANCRQMVFFQKEGTVRSYANVALTRGTTLPRRENVFTENAIQTFNYTCLRGRERKTSRGWIVVLHPQLYTTSRRLENDPLAGTIVTNVPVCITRRRAIRVGLTVRDIDLQASGRQREGGPDEEKERQRPWLCAERGKERKGKGKTRGLGRLVPPSSLSLSPLGNRLYNLCLRMANTERRDYHGTLHLRCQVDLLSIRINDVYARITIGLIYIVRNLLGIVLIVRMIDGTLC